jgi:hypothetical protein
MYVHIVHRFNLLHDTKEMTHLKKEFTFKDIGLKYK